MQKSQLQSSEKKIPHPIEFGAYSEHVPGQIPSALKYATGRFMEQRAACLGELPEWEALRQAGSAIRLHTLENLDFYLEKLEQQVIAAGGQVHWAKDAADACEIVLELARQHAVKRAVKVKSMATEEIGLNHALQEVGIEVVETDLGEYIIQLMGTGPSHIVAPAVHLKKEQIAEVFSQEFGIEAPTDPVELTAIARRVLREKFLAADLGISGANFLVAETGTLVIVTNEGNGRMCTTLPDVHVAVAGIDKVVPDWESLSVLLKLLPRSGAGQKISVYTSFITGPRRAKDEHGPSEFHLVLLDNGRSRILQDPGGRETLKCIRCGSCLNICPVYRNVGGYAYGWFISGPIGAIFTPQILGVQQAGELPFASSLCGACDEVCPVRVPITDILLHLRRRVAEGDAYEPAVVATPLRAAAALGRQALGTGWLYRLGGRLLPWLQIPWLRAGWLYKLPPPLNRWTKVRPLPAFRAHFRNWWKRRHQVSTGDQP